MLADALRAFARTGPGDAIEIDGKVYRRRIQRRVEVIEYVTVLDAHGAEVLTVKRRPEQDPQPKT